MPRLRPWSPERDAAAVLAAFEASADLHRQAPPIRTLADARDHLAAIAGSRDPRHGTAWLSYWLAPAARGQGLAARELGARANNPASIAVAERAGYLREGVERERLRYPDEHGRDERFDVVRLARLATDPAPALPPMELA